MFNLFVIFIVVIMFYLNLVRILEPFSTFYGGVIVKSRKKKIKSLVVVLMVVNAYFIFYRILRSFWFTNSYLDFSATVQKIKIFLFYVKFLSTLDLVFIFLVFLIILVKIKKIIDTYVRYHFLVIYFNFFGLKAQKITVFLQKFEKTIFVKFCKHNYLKYSFYVFFRDNIIKLIMLSFFVKNYFLFTNLIYIGFFKYLVLYSIFLSVYKFFLRFVLEFDTGAIMIYNPEMFCLTALGENNFYLYTRYLIYKKSSFVFLNSSLYTEFQTKKNAKFYYSCNNNNINELIFGSKIYNIHA